MGNFRCAFMLELIFYHFYQTLLPKGQTRQTGKWGMASGVKTLERES